MPNEWGVTDDEFDTWIEEWEAVDRAAAEYLAERIPGVRDAVTDEDARWLDALADTISPDDAPGEDEIESVSAVMEVDGEIEDPAGHLAVLETALLHMAPQWEDLGVLDEDERLTERGTWGLPRALLRTWDDRA